MSRGYVVASINYRLVENVLALRTVQPAVQGAEDARAAVRYLRMKAGEWRLDTNRFAVGGSSAGGMIAEFYGFTKGYSEGESGNPGHDSAINAVIAVSGAMRDVAFCRRVGGAPDYRPSWCVINGEDLTDQMSSGDVPVVMLHGTRDKTIPYVGAMKIDARAKQVGVKHELITIHGGGHVPFGDMFNPSGPYFKRWLTFLSGSLNLAQSECPARSPSPNPSPNPSPKPSPSRRRHPNRRRRTAPKPTPAPAGKWQPCSGGPCCNPYVAQYCPGGVPCQDCGGGSACQCPGLEQTMLV